MILRSLLRPLLMRKHNIMPRVSLSSSSTSVTAKKGREFEVPVPWGIIAGKEYGPPNGHPWIVLHGIFDNCGSFDTLAPLFPLKEHRLLCCDYMGHGRSSHLNEGSSYHFLYGMHVIQRVANHFNLDQFGLMGHSMGGGMSMVYAANFPERVTHLIMLDMIKPISRSVENSADGMRKNVEEQLSIEKKIKESKPTVYSYDSAKERLLESSTLFNMGKATLDDSSADILLKRGTTPVDGGVIFTRDLRHHVTRLYGLTPEVLLELAGRIKKLPFLIVKTDHGSSYGDEELDKQVLNVYRNNPDFTLAEVPGSHHVHLTEPQVVYEHIDPFLKKYSDRNLPSKL